MTNFDHTTIPLGYTYDAAGRVLTYRDSNGYGYEYTYDAAGRELTRYDSNGSWHKFTYDADSKCTATKLHNHEEHHD